MARDHDRHAARSLADAYGISTSWVRTQRRREERQQAPRGPGRPRIPDAERARVRALVHRELERLGFTAGPLPILEALQEKEPHVSVMLVQRATAAIKREVRAAIDREMARQRKGHRVLARDAVWCEDTTHLGRLDGVDEVSGEVISDRGPLSTVSLSVGGAPTAEEVIEDLERGAARRGGWPLVLQRDRGSIYGAQDVTDRLTAEKVVALISRVHTPTDNPVAEHVNRELKEEAGLGTGVVLRSDQEAAARLERADGRLRVRPRASRDWKTADQLDREMPRADTLVDRARFYKEACSATKDAALGLSDPDEIAKAEQDAIWRTLERHGLARLHIGPRHTPRPRRTPVASVANG